MPCMKFDIPKSAYLLGFIAFNLTIISVPAKAPVKEPPIHYKTWIKQQLEEKALANRPKAVIQNLEDFKNELFRYYADLTIPEALTKGLLKEKNFIYENQIDPKIVTGTETRVSKPFLRKRGIEELLSIGLVNTRLNLKSDLVNINKGIEILDGYIIRQGETFAFNEAIGPITKNNGFGESLITSNGQNSTEVGGGVCQLSTALFRAAMNSGLEIDEWRNHSRVIPAYYPIGFDSTIYQGQQDLKFTNNTPGDILIKFEVVDDHVAVYFLGSDDGRVVNVVRGNAGWERNQFVAKWRRVVERDEVVVDDRTFTAYYRDTTLASARDIEEVM